MNASELLDKLNRAGATLEIVDGKPRVRGVKVPDALMAELKANREAVLAEFERRKAEDRDRYCRVPSADAAMLARELDLPPDMKAVVLSYAVRQGPTVCAWVETRAQEYFSQLNIPAIDCAWRAAVDLIAWQRQTNPRGAVEFVAGLDEMQRHLPRRHD